jgi:hypothetical protein
VGYIGVFYIEEVGLIGVCHMSYRRSGFNRCSIIEEMGLIGDFYIQHRRSGFNR